MLAHRMTAAGSEWLQSGVDGAVYRTSHAFRSCRRETVVDVLAVLRARPLERVVRVCCVTRSASLQTWHSKDQYHIFRRIAGAYTSGSVAENSSSAWQGAKISASADILALTELHLVHNLINTTSG